MLICNKRINTYLYCKTYALSCKDPLKTGRLSPNLDKIRYMCYSGYIENKDKNKEKGRKMIFLRILLVVAITLILLTPVVVLTCDVTRDYFHLPPPPTLLILAGIALPAFGSLAMTKKFLC